MGSLVVHLLYTGNLQLGKIREYYCINGPTAGPSSCSLIHRRDPLSPPHFRWVSAQVCLVQVHHSWEERSISVFMSDSALVLRHSVRVSIFVLFVVCVLVSFLSTFVRSIHVVTRLYCLSAVSMYLQGSI